VIKLRELVMILDLHRQGLSVSAIGRSQLDAAASYTGEVAQRIRNALDFSVSPSIRSLSSSAQHLGVNLVSRVRSSQH
jgi:hypothetical protein